MFLISEYLKRPLSFVPRQAALGQLGFTIMHLWSTSSKVISSESSPEKYIHCSETKTWFLRNDFETTHRTNTKIHVT